MSARPATCDAFVFDGPGAPLRHARLPVPAPGPGEVLVRNEYVTLCRSDLNTFTGKRTEPTPTILGHEIVGRIAALGQDAPRRDERGQPLAEGVRVTWSVFASNPASRLSRAEIPQKGDGLVKYGHEPLSDTHTLHGGLSGYTLLRPHTALVALDEGVPLPVAAVINCAGATVAGALRLAEAVCLHEGGLHEEDEVRADGHTALAGHAVAVFGAGMLGVIACAMAREAGATEIVAVDLDADRLATARRFGATATVRADDPATLTQHYGRCGVSFDFSGAGSAMAGTLDVLGIGGVAVWVGGTFPQPPLPLDPERLIRRLHTVRGLHNYNRADFVRAAAFFEAHHAAYPFADLVHGGFALADAEAAFAFALREPAHRVGLTLTSDGS